MKNMSQIKERKKLVIGKPYIIDYPGNKARLCADITVDETKTLYYEVDKEYKEFLCDDRADAFLVGLLHTAMYDNLDIECECRVSERLLFQLNTYFVPIVSERMGDLYTINISAPVTTDVVPTQKAVGTGISGGVDSFYTVMKYKDEKFGSNRITHILFNNIVTADIEEERIRKQHNKDVLDKKQIAEELGLNFVELYSNLYEFYRHPGIFNHYFTMQYASAPLALAHLFGVFYFSSSYTLDSFSLNYDKIPSGAPFDLFTLDCASTESMKFYSAGMEVTRYQKMKLFVSERTSQKHLQVCGGSQAFGGPKKMKKLNCGRCMKCSRAIVSLELMGELKNYESIIDVDLYYKNSEKFIGRYLAGDKGAFSKEVKKNLIEQNKLTLWVKLWEIIYKWRFKLAKNDKIVRLYAKLHK